MPDRLPTGTVTFLYSDIEGSAARWEHEPTQMEVAEERHHAILHACIAAHGGHIVVQVNGATTCELKDYKGRTVGHFALQMHAGTVNPSSDHLIAPSIIQVRIAVPHSPGSFSRSFRLGSRLFSGITFSKGIRRIRRHIAESSSRTRGAWFAHSQSLN